MWVLFSSWPNVLKFILKSFFSVIHFTSRRTGTSHTVIYAKTVLLFLVISTIANIQITQFSQFYMFNKI